MRELVVLSGKGGTGKTTLAGSVGTYLDSLVYADCDVDAPNLHLLLEHQTVDEEPYYGGKRPVVDPEVCTGCGLCTTLCRFEAIEDGKVNEQRCELCEFCFHACPEQAIHLEDALSGHLYVSDTPMGPFVHALLAPAQENSGKLVASVKKKAREIAEEKGYDYAVVDGPPGTGCPVIASISGAHMAVIVTEPTAAALHDLDRAIQLAGHFGVPVAVCLNKCDLDPEKAEEVEKYCADAKIPLVGRIPFSKEVVAAQLEGRAPGEKDSQLRDKFQTVWRNIFEAMDAVPAKAD